MNPDRDLVEIEFDGDMTPRSVIPSGWLQLSPNEAAELLTLPFERRLLRYIENHAQEQCPRCKYLIRIHSLRYFKSCAASELAQFDLHQLEVLAQEATE